MTFEIVEYVYRGALIFASLSAIIMFKKLDKPSKILAILVCCASINEGVAYYLAKKYGNNLALYTVYSLIEYGVLCLYFNKVIDVFIKKNVGLYFGVAGIILGVFNFIFLQPINTLNSYFLLFEGLAVIGMSLFAFFRLLLKDETIRLYRYPRFWLNSILMFFWSATFLYWGLFDYVLLRLPDAILQIMFAALIVGIITYMGFGCVFLLYPKMKNSNE